MVTLTKCVLWYEMNNQTMSRMSNLTDIVPKTLQISDNATPEQLSTTATDIAAGVVTTIVAFKDNVGVLYVANNQDDAVMEASTDSMVLWPGDSISVQINDLSRIWIGCVTNGDGVYFIYER